MNNISKDEKIVASPFLLPVVIDGRFYLRELIKYKDYDICLLNKINRICSKEQLSYFPEKEVDFLFANKLIDYEGSKWRINVEDIEIVAIEVSSVCNWACEYCPNKYVNKAKNSIMDMDLFEKIIDIVSKNNIKNVTFNAYNEPSCEPYFEERINLIKKYKLNLLLFTNGSGLNLDRLAKMKELGIIKQITFNFPTIIKSDFVRITGYTDYDKIVLNIQEALKLGLSVNISVQGSRKDVIVNAVAIREKFKEFGQFEIVGNTTDRAGKLENKYNKKIYIKEKKLFGGCNSVLRYLNVDILGNLFICCNDYDKRYIWGNILNGELKEIINSPQIIDIRKKIFGYKEADKNFICRKCNYMKMAQQLWKAFERRER